MMFYVSLALMVSYNQHGIEISYIFQWMQYHFLAFFSFTKHFNGTYVEIFHFGTDECALFFYSDI